MSKSLNISRAIIGSTALALLGTLSHASETTEQTGGKLGIGREALPAELAAWDVDVLPDGRGLPEGRGTVMDGEAAFVENCASCHGDFAEGRGNWPALAGGEGTLANKDPVKTVGSYWPYASTVWDYVHRSMPFGAAQTLSDDDVYAITAYILYSNYIIEDDFELSHENFAEIVMPNADGFIVDDRPDTEYSQWRAEPCMSDCREPVEITMRATDLGVTPEESGVVVGYGSEKGVITSHEKEEAAAETEETTQSADATEGSDGPDPELVAAGEKVFRKCGACHKIGDGASNGVGPLLTGVMTRTMGGVEGYKYSSAFQDAHEAGREWTDEEMAAFLANPREAMPGTKMAFAGLRKEDEQKAIIAYLRSFD